MADVEQSPAKQGLFSKITRLLTAAATAVLVAWLCGIAMKLDAKLSTPPGFFRGMLHGAVMPMTWPALLAGHDQDIYAQNNSGRNYKLGYSMGVNLSGLIFFGWGFLTLSTLRQTKGRAKKTGEENPKQDAGL